MSLKPVCVQCSVVLQFTLKADGVQCVRDPCSKQPLNISSAKMKRGLHGGKINPCHFSTGWQEEKTSANCHYK